MSTNNLQLSAINSYNDDELIDGGDVEYDDASGDTYEIEWDE